VRTPSGLVYEKIEWTNSGNIDNIIDEAGKQTLEINLLNSQSFMTEIKITVLIIPNGLRNVLHQTADVCISRI
jgi:hypothetical protein